MKDVAEGKGHCFFFFFEENVTLPTTTNHRFPRISITLRRKMTRRGSYIHLPLICHLFSVSAPSTRAS